MRLMATPARERADAHVFLSLSISFFLFPFSSLRPKPALWADGLSYFCLNHVFVLLMLSSCYSQFKLKGQRWHYSPTETDAERVGESCNETEK